MSPAAARRTPSPPAPVRVLPAPYAFTPIMSPRSATSVRGTSVPAGGGGAATANFPTGELYTTAKTPPSVHSIVLGGATPTNTASVQFTITFSESVTGVDSTDFAITAGGVTGASVTNVTGSGTTYTVTVGTGTGDGTIRLDFVSDNSVIDVAGNPAASFNAGQSYTIDKTAPVVQSSVLASTDPSSAATVDFTVTFTESVTGVDSSDFTITAPAIIATSVTNVPAPPTPLTPPRRPRTCSRRPELERVGRPYNPQRQSRPDHGRPLPHAQLQCSHHELRRPHRRQRYAVFLRR